MPKVRKEAVIRAPPERIWALLEDETRMPEWVPPARGFACIARAELVAGPRGAGGLRRLTLEDGHTWEERYVEWDPPRRLAYTLERDTLGVRDRMRLYRATVQITPGEGSGCRVAYRAELAMKGLVNRLFIGPMLARILGGIFDGGLRNIQAMVESPAGTAAEAGKVH